MPSTARFGTFRIGKPGFTVSFRANELLILVDRTTQKFRSDTSDFQKALKAAHEQAAQHVAEGMRDELLRRVEKRGRPQRSTRFLERAIMDKDNRRITASQFAVGLPKYLDSTAARKYWRRVEEGAPKATINTQIMFTTTFMKGDWWRPSRSMLNLRMPQHIRYGAKVESVGPWPDYRYSRGGKQAFQNMDMLKVYDSHLAVYNIPLSSALK